MKTKRFFSVLIAVLMLVSCFAISASAVEKPETGSLTIHLFEGDNSITNTTKAGVTGDYDVTGKTAINGVVFTVTRVADDAADVNAPALTGTDAYSEDTSATANGVTSLTNMPAGRYLVVCKSKPGSFVGTIASFLVDVPMTNPTTLDSFITDVHVYPKTTLIIGDPTVDKLVRAVPTPDVQNPTYGTNANLSNNQAAEWLIDATIPTGFSNYSKYELTDTVAANLSVVAGSLKINGAESVTGVAAAFAGQKLTVTVDPAAFTGTELKITYQTTITSYDTEAGKLIPNHVNLEYNKNQPGVNVEIANPDYNPDEPEDPTDNPKTITVPNDPTDPDHNDNTNNWADPDAYDEDTPADDKDPWVWTGKIDVLKVSSNNTATTLDGVEFSVTGPNGYSTTATTANGGTFNLIGLLDGTYTITETKTIAGYELNTNPITVTITNGVASTTADTFVSQNSTTKVITVKNIPQTTLPLTGGMGVGMFALAGAVLALAGVVFMKKTGKAQA